MSTEPTSASDTLPLKVCILGLLASLVIRVLNCTLRWDKSGLEIDGTHWSFGEPTILAFWHGDQLFAPYSYLTRSIPGKQQRPMYVLISEHADGRIIARAMHHLGIFNIPGSSTRGGLRALIQMKKTLEKQKAHITITPDGPKGPLHEVKPGIVVLSSQTGAPILPMAIAFERYWQIGSWDEMVIPKPFSRARMIAAPLYRIDADLPKERQEAEAEKLAELMKALKKQVEQEVGAKKKGEQ